MICIFSSLRMILSVTLFILFNYANLYSQNDTESTIQVEQLLEQNAGTGEESPDLSELTAMTTELMEHPVNLNKEDESGLRSCGLFSETQIAAIIKHRAEFGPLLAIQELQQLTVFNENVLRQISPFITTGKSIDEPNASFGRMVSEGTHQVIMRGMRVLEKKKGFIENNGLSVYPGSPDALYMRYRFQFMKKISWGITAEKDAGEQFFKGGQKQGFDFYSAHFALRNTGIFKTIVIGDFQLDYGQGLTLCTSMSGGKPSDPVTVKRNGQGIKPYTSSNEVFFKRGAAVSLSKKKFSLDLFFSKRKLDGNMENAADSTNAEELITSFQESGYHRSESELADKNAAGEILYGSHIRYSGKKAQTGITIVQTMFDIPLVKSLQSYNQFEFRGKSLLNMGWDYAWLYRNFNFFGEVGRSQNGAIANLHGVVCSLDPRLGISVVYRNYPREYQVLYSGAMKESGNNYNEKAIYAGINFRPVRVLGVTCTYDKFYFPWLRYGVDAPSGGYEFSGLLTYNPNRKTELYVRCRISEKSSNSNLEGLVNNYLTPELQKGLRFHVTSKISKKFTFRTRVEFVSFEKDNFRSKGMLIFQDVQFHPMASRISFNFRYALFDTDGYESRIYAYENDVLYGYSIPGYYYKGSRIYFNTRLRISKGIDCWLRYAATFYTNRNVIGSGYEEIQGSKRSEVKVQVRFNF